MADMVNLYLRSLESVAEQFKYFFPDKITRVVDAANNSSMRQIILKYKEIEFPYFALQITSSAINHDRALPAKNLRREGAVGGLNSSKTARKVFKILPNTTVFRVLFVANDIKQLYDFIQRWQIAAISNEMNFVLEGADFNIPINLILDESLSVPELELEDVGPLFTLETSISVDTFLGEVADVMLVRKTNEELAMANVTVVQHVYTQESDLNPVVIQ